jgi:hypothetical protein
MGQPQVLALGLVAVLVVSVIYMYYYKWRK